VKSNSRIIKSTKQKTPMVISIWLFLLGDGYSSTFEEIITGDASIIKTKGKLSRP
jgi:hypothetical protein